MTVIIALGLCYFVIEVGLLACSQWEDDDLDAELEWVQREGPPGKVPWNP